MKKRGFIITTIIFFISLTGFFVLIDRLGLNQIIEIFLRVRIWHIAVIIGITFFYFLFFNLRWQRILRLEGYKIPIKDLFMYRFAGHAVSYLTPASDLGGEPIMAHLLSKDHDEITFTKSFAAVVANRLVGLVVNLSFIALAFTYVLFFFVLPEDIKFIFYIVLGAITLLMIIIYIIVLQKKNPLRRIFNFLRLDKLKAVQRREKTIEEFDSLLDGFFHHNPRELLINVGLSLLAVSTLVILFWSLANFLGFNLSILEALVARSIHSVLSSTIPVPASIGFGEAGLSGWFGIMGLGAASGFSFYLIFRSQDIFYSLIGLICLFYKGMGQEAWDLTKKAFTDGINKINGYP